MSLLRKPAAAAEKCMERESDNLSPISYIHICVCICTYKRPHLLEILLKKIQRQKTDGLFAYSAIVVDNDDKMSARPIVSNIQQKSLIKIDYLVEPRKNLAHVRNTAIRHAAGNYIAFIDDDEYPCDDWLSNLVKVQYEYQAHAVFGPVIPYFTEQPQEWLIKGKFCERETYETGTVLHWSKTRTGNVLIDKRVIATNGVAFNPDFGSGGEDVVFFRDLFKRKCTFIWCNEAPVYENVPIERCTKSYFLRRAFFQGNISARYSNTTLKDKLLVSLKSFAAAGIYMLILPIAYVGGMHRFMKYLIKDVHHLSRLLALFGIVVVKKRNL